MKSIKLLLKLGAAGLSALGLWMNFGTQVVAHHAFSAEFDPLCDDGANYCARIREEGGNAEWHLELGLVHGYLRARHISQKASKSFERIQASIKMISEIN